uniref:Uncharacterized protein n=1 Tax=Medicago truncatula TaxID=3880 RepID=Q2HTY3_MEDTR|nr:hypothetical protein MtrDRAFT_AC149577g24v1 [Medicago truncatula]
MTCSLDASFMVLVGRGLRIMHSEYKALASCLPGNRVSRHLGQCFCVCLVSRLVYLAEAIKCSF